MAGVGLGQRAGRAGPSSRSAPSPLPPQVSPRGFLSWSQNLSRCHHASPGWAGAIIGSGGAFRIIARPKRRPAENLQLVLAELPPLRPGNTKQATSRARPGPGRLLPEARKPPSPHPARILSG
ncbi:hypothetical protein P279_28640 [Rhodobacteraceae bacterium PD-2]|nr:hypothetical protein P279_28640 [Rhodobacteraceae bacterium PD-2]